MIPSTKKAELIIVNFNSTDYLAACLRSLYDTEQSDLIQVHIVDNCSNDNVDQIKRHFPDINLIKNDRNVGFGKAVNIALRKCQAPFVILLNPDTTITNGFFSKIFNFFESHKDIGILGPKIKDLDGGVQGSARSFPTPMTSLFGRNSPITKLFPKNSVTRKNILTIDNNGNRPFEVDWVSGACMVVRSSAIEEVGMIDERFFMYWEDTDWCKRMKDNHWKVVYFPGAEVMHVVGRSSNTMPLFSIFHFHKSCYLLFKKYARFPSNLLEPVAIVGLMFRCILAMIHNLVSRCMKSKKRM